MPWNKIYMKKWMVVIVALLALDVAGENISLPAFFSNNMVVQRDLPISIWGKTDPGAEVAVSFKGRKGKAIADASGKWRLQLDSLPASAEPAQLVAGDLVFTNVLVGDVWLCTGQSNMEWPLKKFNDTSDAIAGADSLSQMRLLNIHYVTSPTERLDDVRSSGWLVNSQKAAADFSATGYYFGSTLQRHLNVPIGLISCNRGGSVAETWISEEALEANALTKIITLDPWNARINDSDLEQKMEESMKAYTLWKEARENAVTSSNLPPRPKVIRDPRISRDRPGNCFRGMVHPLIGLGLKGAIWYQGESNGGLVNTMSAGEYYQLLSTLITDWRARWGQGDFPFLIVQLPSARRRGSVPVNQEAKWPEIREGQRRCLELENTGLAVICDNEDTSLHPKGKKIVGERLALLARGIAYKEDITYSGPLYVEGSLKIVDDQAELKFTHVGEGLVLKDAPTTGFAIRGEDGSWEHAKVRVENDMVTVWSDAVQNPVAVRYAWMGGVVPTLHNKAGLLASPFKTD